MSIRLHILPDLIPPTLPSYLAVSIFSPRVGPRRPRYAPTHGRIRDGESLGAGKIWARHPHLTIPPARTLFFSHYCTLGNKKNIYTYVGICPQGSSDLVSGPPWISPPPFSLPSMRMQARTSPRYPELAPSTCPPLRTPVCSKACLRVLS